MIFQLSYSFSFPVSQTHTNLPNCHITLQPLNVCDCFLCSWEAFKKINVDIELLLQLNCWNFATMSCVSLWSFAHWFLNYRLMNPSIHHSISITQLLLWDTELKCPEASRECIAIGPTHKTITISKFCCIMTLEQVINFCSFLWFFFQSSWSKQ